MDSPNVRNRTDVGSDRSESNGSNAQALGRSIRKPPNHPSCGPCLSISLEPTLDTLHATSTTMPLYELPSEIILHITQFLEPLEIVNLQHISKRFLNLGRDDTLWRERCYIDSKFLDTIRRRKEALTAEASQDPGIRDLARALAAGNGLADGDSRLVQPREEARDIKKRSNEKIRVMANWDPSYPNEKVRWYDEYIARNAPISTSWMQQPRHREGAEHEYLEARGMAIYRPPGEEDATIVIAPLDDGSLCLWDMNGTRGRKGAIIGRSKSGLLSVDRDPKPQDARRSKMINTGVTECISIDSAQRRAYVAVQSGLMEIDLETLSTISHERFPFSITALSDAKHPVPLTVGTNLSLYLHDSRKRSTTAHGSSGEERLDSYDAQFSSLNNQESLNFRSLLNPEPSPDYAHLHQPGPLSILHLNSSGDNWDGNGDIYVAGRFASILNYDRRFFPKLRGTVHSGARLCSMASLPYYFASMEKSLARRGELTMEQILEFKNCPGKTLIACGEYNSKGSLEMYGLSPNPLNPIISSSFSAGSLQNSVMKNRQTSSSSKLLSVANHGTRIVFSDGGGNLKWLERDGFTEVRRWNISHGSVEAPRGIFGTLGDSYMDSGSGDIVLKLIPCASGRDERAANDGELALWTGEKIGLLSFANKPGFRPEDFEEQARTAEQAHREREERVYSETMRRALEHQANEVRYVRGLGIGMGTP